MSRMVEVETPACMHCGSVSFMEVDEVALESYRTRTKLIQEAFPDLGATERELLKTGIHEECWTEMFGNEEEE